MLHIGILYVTCYSLNASGICMTVYSAMVSHNVTL